MRSSSYLKGGEKLRAKGISTVMGAAIFLLIFMVMVSGMMLWTRSYVSYMNALKEEEEFTAEKVVEELSLMFLNSSGKLTVMAGNPTPHTIILTQIWSNHTVQTGEWAVPPKTRVYINTTLDYAGMAASKVVTNRGNVFSGMQLFPAVNGTEIGEDYIIDAGRWYVQWYNLSERRVFDTKVGETYWQSLSHTFQWGSASNDPIVGPYTQAGFNATTRVVALAPKMYINYYVGEDVRIIIRELGLDSGWNTGSGYVEADVSVGAVYTVTVLYSRWTGPAFLTINFVGVDFVSLLKE